jgi:hypothetical protein
VQSELDMLSAVIAGHGGDPAIVMPLLDIMSIAAISSAQAKLDGDNVAAAIHYGRVAGILESLNALGQPTPIERPSEAVLAAEQALIDPEGVQRELEAAIQAALDEAEAAE